MGDFPSLICRGLSAKEPTAPTFGNLLSVLPAPCPAGFGDVEKHRPRMEPCGTPRVTSASLVSPQCPSHVVRDPNTAAGTPGASGIPLPSLSRALEHPRLSWLHLQRAIPVQGKGPEGGKSQEQSTGEMKSRGKPRVGVPDVVPKSSTFCGFCPLLSHAQTWGWCCSESEQGKPRANSGLGGNIVVNTANTSANFH